MTFCPVVDGEAAMVKRELSVVADAEDGRVFTSR